MKTLAIVVLVVSVAAGSAAFAADAASTALAKITGTCQSCHGAGGNSTSAKVPRLNGQMAGYLTARLKAFRDPTQQTPNATHAMWDMSNHIGDDEIPQIAKYYAAQTPTPAAAAASALAKES